MIEINPELCTKCLNCVNTCPSLIFTMDQEHNTVGVEFEEYCITCGHCLAICPEDAIRHEKFDQEFQDVPSIKINPQDLYTIFQTRRSIRNFTKKPISQDLIQHLIIEASYAPTSSNLQNVRYLILQGDSINAFVSQVREFYVQILKMFQTSQSETTSSTMARRLRKWNYWAQEAKKGNDALFYNPSAIIIVYAPSAESFSSLNVGFATAYLMLAAHANGLGTCNIGYAVEAIKRKPEIAEEQLGISTDEYGIYAVLSLGYPVYEYYKIIPRNPPSISWRY